MKDDEYWPFDRLPVPKLRLNHLLDGMLLQRGYAAGPTAGLPHADYSKKVGDAVLLVSMDFEKDGIDLMRMSLNYVKNPIVSLGIGINSRHHRTALHLSLFSRELHSCVCDNLHVLCGALLLLEHLSQSPRFVPAIAQLATPVDMDGVDFSILEIGPIFRSGV